jgi:iron complex transport system substrate-binding protein
VTDRRPKRIVSFLPAATEMACVLGLEDQLAGVSHECDYPKTVRGKPVVVHPALQLASLGPAEIDVAVAARLRTGESLYAVDEALLRALDPHLILTQDLCQVCAPSGNDVMRLLASLPRQPHVLYFTPRTLDDIWDNLRALGDSSDTREVADAIVRQLKRRLDLIAERVSGAPCPRVFFAEWVDPVYCGGHWIPEMIELAGGSDPLARRGVDSVRVSWDQVIAAAPEVVVVAPCGYSCAEAESQVPLLAARPGWDSLPAVRSGRVFAVDASAYYARPGPRLVDGVELLAHLLHPERVHWNGSSGAFRVVAGFTSATLRVSAT